jgi:hypothetical protein
VSVSYANHGFLVRVNRDRVILEPECGQRPGLVFEPIAGVGPPGGIYLEMPVVRPVFADL